MTTYRKQIPSHHCMVENLEPRQMFSAGTLDTSFSLDGKATVNFGQGVRANDVAVQGDGKTVVVGFTTGAQSDFAVARFNFDGTPDTTFGPNHQGFVITPMG